MMKEFRQGRSAVLITCFNRKTKTIACLEQLFSITNSFDVYLVDDNSTDGTPEAVKEQFPVVNLIKGTGNLFWNRGMYLAWKHAKKRDYDFYIWLNDDVKLYAESFHELFKCSSLNNNKAIISGIIEDSITHEPIYGGFDKSKKLFKPTGETQEITFMNGNIVLVPKQVFYELGNLDPFYHHDLGDVDYGLRAKKKGIKVLTTRIAVGGGEKNQINRLRKRNLSLIKRFEELYSPLGSNPKITFYFNKRHFGYNKAISFFLFVVVINLLPDKVVEHIFKGKYY